MKTNLTKTTTYHYIKFAWRTLLFLIVLAIYIANKVLNASVDPLTENYDQNVYIPVILCIIWAAFVIEMFLRFFPSKLESMGCQKQFKRNFVQKEPVEPPKKQAAWRTVVVAASWIALNAIFVTLYYLNIIDGGILMLISLFYAVCDMICILFFCPFQTWMMKNRCCVSCRIYNWDFAMMFTPIAFLRIWNWFGFSISLSALAVILLIEWEILYKVYPQRFCTNTNESLACANCKEKLCKHKKQLRSFIKKISSIDISPNKENQD